MPLSKHRRRSGRAAPAGRSAFGTAAPTGPKRKKTNYVLLAAFIIIALLVIGSFGLTTIPFRGGTAGTGKSTEYVAGVGTQQTLMATRNHLPEGRTAVYNTTPPTSGDHWETPARCGLYEKGLPDERMVHNLEHGNIVVNYNLANRDQVDKLRDTLQKIRLSEAWGVARFYDQLPQGTVALATWGVLDVMEGVDPGRIKRFFENYAGNLGPEKVPCR